VTGALLALPLGAGCSGEFVAAGATGQGTQAVACKKTSDCGAGLTCQSGVCAKGPACTPAAETCNGKDDDCDGVVDDGAACPDGQACVDGACSDAPCLINDDCGPGMTCASSQCQPTVACASGTADCDGDPANACETDTRTDASHCGACDSPCREGEGCVEGGCVAAATCASEGECGGGLHCVDSHCK
jgi:hypothetical protein